MPKPFEVEIWGGDRKEYQRTEDLVNNCFKEYKGEFSVKHVPVDVEQRFLRLICTRVHMGSVEIATMELGKLELTVDVLLRRETVIF